MRRSHVAGPPADEAGSAAAPGRARRVVPKLCWVGRRFSRQAETRVKQFEAAAGAGKPSPEKLAALERENRDLRERLAKATARTKEMVERVRFLREQQSSSPAGS